MSNTIASLLSILYHDIQVMIREPFSWLTPLFFFIIVVCLFPLVLGSDSSLLNTLAPGIIWVAALLAIVISIGHLFRHDAETGFLDLWRLSSYPLTVLVLCRILTHWITHCLPLILVSPLLGFLLDLPIQKQYALIMTLLLGTPVLSLIGAIGAGLTVGVRSHTLLLPILIIPLYVPTLLFGTGIMMASDTPQSMIGQYAIMGALMLISLAFAPLLTSMALKNGNE